MKKLPHTLLQLVVVLIFLFACTKEITTIEPNNTIPRIFPLKVGNQWYYKNSVIGSTFYLKINSLRKSGGTEFYKVDDGSRDNSELFYQCTILYKIAHGAQVLVLKDDMKIGDTWNWIDWDNQVVNASVLQYTSVSVPAGTFNAWRIKFSGGESSEYWISPGVGFVKIIGDHPATEIYELTSYTILP